MGYKHYFPHAYATAAIISDAKDIVATSPVAIAGPSGDDEPVFNLEQGIMLNGDLLFGEAYEVFNLAGTEQKNAVEASYCVTEKRPYDAVVVAILISAHIHTGVSFSTDGRWGDWAEGTALFEKAVRPLTSDEKLGLEMIVESMVYTPKPKRNRRSMS